MVMKGFLKTKSTRQFKVSANKEAKTTYTDVFPFQHLRRTSEADKGNPNTMESSGCWGAVKW